MAKGRHIGSSSSSSTAATSATQRQQREKLLVSFLAFFHLHATAGRHLIKRSCQWPCCCCAAMLLLLLLLLLACCCCCCCPRMIFELALCVVTTTNIIDSCCCCAVAVAVVAALPTCSVADVNDCLQCMLSRRNIDKNLKKKCSRAPEKAAKK